MPGAGVGAVPVNGDQSQFCGKSVGWLHNSVSVLDTPECTLKDGEGGTFHVMCIYHHF